MTGWMRTALGNYRCQACGAAVTVAWIYFPAETPTTWTVCYCEACAEALAGTEV